MKVKQRNTEGKNFVWEGENPTVGQVCFFQGQHVMVMKTEDSNEEYTLVFLGFESEPIIGIDSAKEKAPDFIKSVLDKMKESV